MPRLRVMLRRPVETDSLKLWARYKERTTFHPEIDLVLDLSRVDFADDFFETMKPAMDRAFTAMTELEGGAIANPDENRMVGHYWLRNPALAPTEEITVQIESALDDIKSFVADVHEGNLAGPDGPFENLLLIGIGGSALGPQFVSHALGQPSLDRMRLCFLTTQTQTVSIKTSKR